MTPMAEGGAVRPLDPCDPCHPWSSVLHEFGLEMERGRARHHLGGQRPDAGLGMIGRLLRVSVCWDECRHLQGGSGAD